MRKTMFLILDVIAKNCPSYYKYVESDLSTAYELSCQMELCVKLVSKFTKATFMGV